MTGGGASHLLMATVRLVVRRLIAEDRIEISIGSDEAVIDHCIVRLSEPKPGAQVVSTIVSALLDSPDVVELYATNDEIKAFITESRNFSCPT